MEFTKEEIEIAKKIYCSWNDKQWEYFCDYADSLVKPETKKIVVEIENNSKENVTASEIQAFLQTYLRLGNCKVTELPEGTWTDHHMKLFALYYMPDCKHNLEDSFSNFKAERKSELGK